MPPSKAQRDNRFVFALLFIVVVGLLGSFHSTRSPNPFNFTKMMLKPILTTLLFCQGFSLSYGQNLVLNPSFEQGAQCDGSTERIKEVQDWTPISGRPGYINTQCQLSKDAKSFVIGMRLPSASYGNVYTIQKFDVETECQQGRLSTPLVAGQSYVVSLWVRLPIQFCQTPIDEVGVVLGEKPLAATDERRAITAQALSLKTDIQDPISHQYNWVWVSALYVAKGGEQYIAIGNFANNNSGAFDNRPEKACTYLFMDGVEVRAFDGTTLSVYDPENLQYNQRFFLKDVHFVQHSSNFSPGTEAALDQLAKQLKATPELHAALSVYVNDNLDAATGLALCYRREEKLIQYLLKKGIDNVQFTVECQEEAPTVAITDGAGQQTVRGRVEVLFTTVPKDKP